MIPLNFCFQYNNLSRKESNGARHYVHNNDLLPSVTTILSSLEKSSGLQDWINSVGEEAATQIKDQSAAVGSTMHDNIEQYILHGTKPVGKVLEKILSNLIINDLNKHMTECNGTEACLYYPSLYAGTTDCVGVYDGKLSIIDFKNSRSDKKIEYLESYFLQCAAYGVAHDLLYGTSIDQYVILMSCWSGNLIKVVMDQTMVSNYKIKWANLLETFYSQ